MLHPKWFYEKKTRLFKALLVSPFSPVDLGSYLRHLIMSIDGLRNFEIARKKKCSLQAVRELRQGVILPCNTPKVKHTTWAHESQL